MEKDFLEFECKKIKEEWHSVNNFILSLEIKLKESWSDLNELEINFTETLSFSKFNKITARINKDYFIKRMEVDFYNNNFKMELVKKIEY